MAPPPPPPPSDDTTMGLNPAMLVTPPQKHKTHSYGYNFAAHGRDRRGTVTSSPATSHASSAASPLLKARSAGEVLSPRLRGSRMDPYPRYSPRKRLSADFSDGTYSADSGADSPKSEKGGWRIHAAVAGPFLTGPLAEDFTARLDELRSPRGKRADEPDFDHSGLLLFPVVPDFVAPAITPEVFQASIQPATVTQTQPQPEPDYSAVAPPSEACYYPPNTDQYYAQPPATDAAADASWDASAQMQQQQQQESYYYAEQQQQYSAEQEYYYNNGYDQYNSAAYTNGEYVYQQTYEQYPVAAEQVPAEVAETSSTEAFPPLPSHNAATPEVDTSLPTISDDVAASNQVAEAATTDEATTVPGSPVRRQRAPSYAEIVTGAAHTTPAVPEQEASKVDEVPKKAAAKANFATFDQLSDGIAESMSRILAKSNGNKTHAEVEFSCLVHRIQTQLKLMGRVSNSLHLKQMKTMHKLQQSEIEKLSVESSNMELLTRVKKYEQEQEELKKQLAEALEAKDVRLKDAVDQLSSKINTLKNSTDASTSTLASEIDAIQKCSSPDDLEKRVEEIGQVIDYLIENSGDSSSKSNAATPKPKIEARRHSIGSWKAIALYAIVVWAASLCGVWVGVKYAGSMQSTSAITYTEMQKPDVMEAPVITEAVFVGPTPTVFEEVSAPVVEMVEAEIREVAVEIEQPASIDLTQSFVEPAVVDEVAPHIESTDDSVFIEDEVVEVPTPIEEVQEVLTPIEEVEEMQTPTEAVSEPSLVFTFEQVTRSSPSCFSCLSDHSTMASFFCEMLAEVMPSNSIILEEHVPDEVSLVETSTESVIDAANALSTEVFADAIEEAVEEIVAPVDAVVEEPSTVETLEAVSISQTTGRRSVANMMSSPLAHALYVWCPSLFDMHPEEKDAASGPLSDLARALTSLSSQILSEHAPSIVEEDVDESQMPTFVIIEETHEDTVAISEVEAPMTEDVEVADVVADAEDVEVAIVEEPVVDETAAEEAVADVPSNRRAAEQLLINIGAMSGTAPVVAHTATVTVAEIEEADEAWSFSAETAVSLIEEDAKFVNSSAVEVVPSAPVAEVAEVPEVASTETVDAAVEIVPVVEDVAVAVEEVVSSCPLESCPLFKDATAEEPKFSNSSLPAVPTFQVVEDSAAADNEISEAIGSSPALDLKSVLLNSL